MTHLCVDICQNFAVRFFSQTSIKLSFLTDFFLFFFFFFVFFFFFFFFNFEVAGKIFIATGETERNPIRVFTIRVI